MRDFKIRKRHKILVAAMASFAHPRASSQKWFRDAVATLSNMFGMMLTSAIKALQPTRPRGPWHVLCDNETFLRTAGSKAAYRRANVVLWDTPRSSPDFNPVEKFWGWLRKQLRVRGRADLSAKRAPLTKAEFSARVHCICRTRRTQNVAKRFAKGLRKVCAEVVAKQFAASSK